MPENNFNTISTHFRSIPKFWMPENHFRSHFSPLQVEYTAYINYSGFVTHISLQIMLEGN